MSVYPHSVEKANSELQARKIAYESTSKPLYDINDNLKDIKVLLSEILILLKKRV